MLRLHLLRHADAGDPMAWDGPDAARPLSEKGRLQAERLGRFLAGAGFRTDALISSPKVRARETAEIVADFLEVEVRLDGRLASGLGYGPLAALLDEAGGPLRPVIVGHDPDFSDLLSSLVGANLTMKKGAIAAIEVPSSLAPGGGALRWLLPPSLLAG